MGSNPHFATFRLIVISLVALIQIYLFVRFRQIIRSGPGSNRGKSWAIGLSGLAILLLFAVNLRLVYRPVVWPDPPAAVQAILFYLPAVWGFGSIFTALLLGLIQFAGWFGRRLKRLYRGGAGSQTPMPVNPGRRRFLQATAGAVATAPLVLTGYGVAQAAEDFEVRELALPFGQPLRVVQLTDIHAGIYMSRAQMRLCASRVMALQPDLFVLTGDFISNSLQYLSGCAAEMGRVQARYGTFAVLGNHEHWQGSLAEIQRILQQHGVALLRNAHRVIHTGRGAFAVAGIDDLRAGRPDLKAALAGLEAAIPTLLLSHRPEIFPKAAAHGIPLTLSGHYHGGQIKLRLPGGAFSVAELITPYPEGLYRRGASHLYVSRGIGTTFTPVRLNVPPEITLLQLT